ncbi:autophagy-related protein 22-like protein [Schizophyllum amplum]|uniref:Autophagy-related protein n=1 Tax=Schizophyllum amplum TaxID=97359 RepID=A0A550C0E9_9AGAR|nr:autophagy-related protein 22-like protein [Auriculariopsis ampla]
MTSFLTDLYKRKLYGWLLYAFASEVFVIVSLTLFLPVALEQFARDNGFLLPDKTQACSSANVRAADEFARCVVKIGWFWVDSASFSLYVNSISVALQALTVISMGGIADHPPHRKRLLLLFAFLGSISAICFLLLPSSAPVWWLCAVLGIFANVGFGASTVAMNAYLPELGRNAPSVLQLAQDGDLTHCTSDDSDSEADPLLTRSIDDEPGQTSKQTRYEAELSRTTSRISSMGIASGYGAGILMLILALIPVTLLEGSTFSLRLAIGLSGVWWAVFSVAAGALLPGASAAADEEPFVLSTAVVGAWKRLGGMLRWSEIVKLRNTFQYLAAWFLLSDGFTTITSTALLFAKTSLHMPPSSLIIIGVLSPLSGIAGALVWPVLQRRLGWSNLRVLITLVIGVSLIPAYGCIGFAHLSVGGLTTPGEMYGLAVVFGSVYGAFQSYARAFYAELLPPGEEARWYGLFSITDKSSSFIGPLVVGFIADMTGNIRYAFFFLIVMIWLAVPILMTVDVERGRRDAQGYRYSS